MSRALVLALACLIPIEASALSCMRPNMAHLFNPRMDAEEVYVLALGHFTPLEPLPKVASNFIPGEVPQSGRARHRFEGRLLGATALSVPRRLEVDVEAQCLAHWCGAFPEPGRDILVFLQRGPEGEFAVSFGPCASGYHWDPRPEHVEALQRCLAKGACGDAEIGVFFSDF